MASWVWIVIAIVVIAVIAVAALAARRRKSAVLRKRFGPEYDRAVAAHEDRRTAESDLRAREKERGQFQIKPLPEETRVTFAHEWRKVQERFVDQPSRAVAAAGNLVTRVMAARGYPMRDFEEQASLVSVDHPGVAENYRFAHAVWQRSQAQEVSTDDLRQALLRYRSLFDELLQPTSEERAAGAVGGAEPGRPAVSPDRPASVAPPAGAG